MPLYLGVSIFTSEYREETRKAFLVMRDIVIDAAYELRRD